MPRPYASNAYPESYYDDHFCLKPPLMLWLAVIYLSRTITLPVLMGIGAFAKVNQNALAVFHQFWSLETLLPSLIACSVLIALVRRAPQASKPLRWLWAHGKNLLALSASLDIAISFLLAIRQGGVDQQVLVWLFAAAIDAYFLLYILLARRVRDTFADFPLPD